MTVLAVLATFVISVTTGYVRSRQSTRSKVHKLARRRAIRTLTAPLQMAREAFSRHGG
jgi:hypothetical protein